MLQPLARQALNQTARTKVVLPPVGGWNTRDAYGNMPEQDAILLENWFPRQRDVVLRKGYVEHSDTEESASVQGLVSHDSGADSQLIAIVNGSVFNVTTDTPGSALATGLDNAAEVFGFNFKGYSFYCNGEDAIQRYDGSTFAASTFDKDAGESETFTSADITFGMGYSNRPYFGGDGLCGFWYSNTVNAVAGANLEYFPLDGVFQKGGYLSAMGTLTDDDGAGRNDFAVFVSSKGQVALYSGTDPGDANNWSIIGIYDIGEPVTRFGITKFGADLVIITRDGYIPMSSVLAGRDATSKRYALSDKIVSEANDVTDRYKDNAGWRMFVYPRQSMLIVNVPRTATAYDQHVMNTVTGAWCRFRNIPATSWAIFNERAYFGSTDGKIYLFDEGTSDGDSGITADAKAAWNGFGMTARVKQFVMAQPIFISDASPLIQVGFAVDFSNYEDTGFIQAAISGSVGVWDEGIWDASTWAGIAAAVKEWVGLSGVGYQGSLRVRVSEAMAEISWASTSVIYKSGGLR